MAARNRTGSGIALNLVSHSFWVVADAAVKPRRSLPWVSGVARAARAMAEAAEVRSAFSTENPRGVTGRKGSINSRCQLGDQSYRGPVEQVANAMDALAFTNGCRECSGKTAMASTHDPTLPRYDSVPYCRAELAGRSR